MAEDNLMRYKGECEEEQRMIEEIMQVKAVGANDYYNFTSIVIYVMQIFNQYYDRMVSFVKDSELNKSQLHDHLSALFLRVVTTYGGQLVQRDQPLQIAQGEVNLHYCEMVFRYFSN
jgi:hypothetical protein